MEHKGYSTLGMLVGSHVIQRMGLDATRELSRFGLSPERLRTSLVGLPPLLEDQWFHHLADVLRDEAIGVHVSERMLVEDMELYGFFLSSQATVRDAMSAMCAVSGSLNDAQVRLIEGEGWARLEGHSCNPLVWSAFRVEARLRFVTAFLRETVAGLGELVAVWHRHPAPAHAAEIERSHGMAALFGQPVDALVFDARLLDRPLKSANPHMAQSLGRMLKAQATSQASFRWSDQARLALSVLLPQGRCSLPDVARAIGAPAHVLKYELAKEGTTFREQLDAFRRMIVLQRLLGTSGMTVEKMAVALGFRDPRQFYRRFKQWTGRTVTAYRAGDRTPPN